MGIKGREEKKTSSYNGNQTKPVLPGERALTAVLMQMETVLRKSHCSNQADTLLLS